KVAREPLCFLLLAEILRCGTETDREERRRSAIEFGRMRAHECGRRTLMPSAMQRGAHHRAFHACPIHKMRVGAAGVDSTAGEAAFSESRCKPLGNAVRLSFGRREEDWYFAGQVSRMSGSHTEQRG